MAMMVLPMTLTIAGAATLLNIWLAARVSRMRAALKVASATAAEPLIAADAGAGQLSRMGADLADPDRPDRACRRRARSGSGRPA
jgi:hypothetical protein